MTNNPDVNDRKALLKNALVALDEMQSRLNAVEAAKHEPIAIVGMACRFPGGANSPDKYWELLHNGVDAVREVPANRWDMSEYADLNIAWWGGFIDNIDQFDPQFFGITPREAASMDPQQRLVLEVGWEALENAGQAPDKLAGSQTGVFIGITTNDYAQLVKQIPPAEMDVYSATGTALNAAPGRLAYTLGLQGPSIAVDTACSSSLVAIHLAMQSLRNGETNMAIAGGVNALLVPENFVCFAGWGMMAPDGRCKTFDASADGFVRGEGCGILVLKRLSDAIADGNHIHAILRGSAVNQDGRSSGLTVPNGPAQQEVVRKALKNARVNPADVSYVEAHGTGTSLGDPIEVEALGAALGENRPSDQPLVIGSVKTNLGHLESASGIAGLMKVVLSLQHQEIPPHLHFHERSSRIPWPDFQVTVPTTPIAWPIGEASRFAGVSSFGFSGTNAHIIIEEAPRTAQPTENTARPAHILTLSAKNEQALRDLAAHYAADLATNDHSLADVAFTSNTGRAVFNHRLALTAETASQMHEQLAGFAEGVQLQGASYNVLQSKERPKVAFLFTGQGSQYVGMGWDLYQSQPVFRDTLNQCDELLRPHLVQSLLSVIYPQDGVTSPLDHTAYTQPALFALEYALAKLWQSWGIEPAAVMGHSVGEYVAACIAGVMSLEDSLMLIATRGRLMGALPAGGQMAAIFADEATVRTAIQADSDKVSVAAVNGPENTVISGDGTAIQAVLTTLNQQGIKSRALNVSHAFHSPLMEPMMREFENAAKTVSFNKPRIKLISNVTGQAAGAEVQTAAYWVRHIREAVRFGDSVAALHEMGCNFFLEVGPGSTLLGMGQRCLPELSSSAHWLSSLRKGQNDWLQILNSLGELFVHQAPVDWAAVEHGYAHQRIVLPTYPFQREHYWITTSTSNRKSRSNNTDHYHPLLGKPMRSPLVKETIFETNVSVDYPAFITDHRVYGSVVFPATGYLEMALAAGMTLREGAQTIRNLSIQEAFILPDTGERSLQMVMLPDQNGNTEFKIVSVQDTGSSWKMHAAGQIASQPAPASTVTTLRELQSQPRDTVAVDQYYQQLFDSGLNYGKTFQCITGLWVDRDNRNVLGQIHIAADASKGYYLFPGLIDACFQLLGAMLSSEDSVYLPVLMEEFSFNGLATTDLWAYATVRNDELHGETLTADLSFFDLSGNLIGELNGLRLKKATRQTLERLMQPSYDEWLYEVDWKPIQLADTNTSGEWLILADQSGTGEQLAAELQTRGASRSDVVYVDGNATSVEYFDNLLNQAVYRGVISLWALDMQVPEKAVDTTPYLNTLHLTQALAKRGDAAPSLTIITRNAQQATIADVQIQVEQSALWGLGRVIGLEQPTAWHGLIDTDSSTPISLLTQGVLQTDSESQLALRGEIAYSARLTHSTHKQSAVKGSPVELITTAPGILDNLELIPLTRRSPSAGEIEVQVLASGLNFRDVLNALGMYPGVAPLGNECAGIIVGIGEGVSGFAVGDEVIALGSGTFKSYVTVTADQVFHKPATLTFAESVSVPTTFLTAAYGLNHLANVQPGQRVLIHSAAGGVGMAAVQLMQRAGAEIFATAGSPEKRTFLERMGIQHVMNSRTLDFAQEIMTITNGAGVDVVLNSLSDEFIPKSLSVLAPNGVFLEIGKRGVWADEQVSAAYPTVKYHLYDLVQELDKDPESVWSLLHQLLADLGSGALSPLPTQTFPIENAVEAFRHMAQAKHIGKVVVTHQPAKAIGELIHSEATYLITGGLGGLGLKVADWMVEHGARNLVLLGRSTPSEAAQTYLQQWHDCGAYVHAVQADVSNREQMADIINTISQSMPRLRGIIHAAGIVDDALLVNQNDERFERVLAPKVQGAWNLHELTKKSTLDFFVLFSAGAAVMGSSGQGNYAAANAFLDGLAHYRRTQGLPALSINWGAWSEVGMAAALGDPYQQRFAAQGISSISPTNGVKVLEHLMVNHAVQMLVMPVKWDVLAGQFLNGVVPPFLSLVAQVTKTAAPSTNRTAASEPSLRSRLEASTTAERRDVLVAAIREQVEKVLGLNASHNIGLRQGLMEMGMDSLMAVELSNRLKALTGQSLPTTLAFEYPTIHALADYLEQNVLSDLMTEPEAAPTSQPNIEEKLLAELEALSDDEIESSVLDELKKAGY
ncbi:MAG: type I polyketide synthase [Chloroflexi bacterium]|nr:type I polyketide synthase [Chloroflexota bacterium]MCC6892492.1 type I polyketide synthase [Anaerolineae bacterium]